MDKRACLHSLQQIGIFGKAYVIESVTFYLPQTVIDAMHMSLSINNNRRERELEGLIGWEDFERD